MKKVLLIIMAFLFAASTAFSQFHIGVGGSLGSETSFDRDSDDGFGVGAGLHARAMYNFFDYFAIVGGFTYYFPEEVEEIDINQMGFNADLNYNFIDNKLLKAYFLGGLGYNALRLSNGDESGTEWGLGIHVGAGAIFKKFFIEAKYEFEHEFAEGVDRPGLISGTIGYYIGL